MEEESRAGRRKQLVNFNDDLTHMLYAFGDSKKPEQDTVDALQEYLIFFLDKVIEKSLGRAQRRENQALKLVKEDVIYLIKNDPKWMARVAYIMERKVEINKITKQIKSDES